METRREPGDVPAATIDSEEVRVRILALAEAIGGPVEEELQDAGSAESGIVRELPPWVGRHGLVRAAGCFWLLCEAGRDPASTFPSQVVLDLPPGRYILDTFDAAARRWIARESAAAAPLVAGLCHTGGPVLLRIRRFG